MSDLTSWLHEFADACEIVAAGRWPGPRTAARLREVADALAAAKQQGQAVAECHCATCTCAPGMTPAVRFDLSPAEKEGAIRDHLIALGWTPPNTAAPPSAPVGVEWPLSLLRAGHWREVYIGHRCMRLEVTYDYATWERLMAEVESALAQQPAAVVDDTRRIRALADNYWRLEPFDMPMPGGDDADVGWRVIEFHRAEPRERVVVEHYRDNPREAIDAALAAQQQGGAE